MTITPERLARIRGLGDDELRTVIECDGAIDDLLWEVDSLRSMVLSLTSLLRSTQEIVNIGGRPDSDLLGKAAALADELAGKGGAR
jgi:hypothetical protein